MEQRWGAVTMKNHWKSSFLQGNDTPRNHTSWENNNMKFLDMLSTEVSLLLVSKVVESEGIDLKC